MCAPEEGKGHCYVMEVLDVKTDELGAVLATSEHMSRGRLVNALGLGYFRTCSKVSFKYLFV